MPHTMLFPTPVGQYDNLDLEICKKAAESVIDIIKTEDHYNHSHLGDVTYDNLHLKDEFQSLVNLVNRYTQVFSNEVLGINFNDLTLSCMWSNTHNSGSYHPTHIHPNCFLSGVLYVQCPESDWPGNLELHDPRPAKLGHYPDYVKESCLTREKEIIKPEVGRLVLFPSWLPHSVDMYKSNSKQPRISIAFNYVLNRASISTGSFNT